MVLKTDDPEEIKILPFDETVKEDVAIALIKHLVRQERGLVN